MALPKVSEQWSQLGCSLVLTLIENEAVVVGHPRAREEEIINGIRSLLHLAFRFGLEPQKLSEEAMQRYTHDLETEEP